MGGFIDFIKAWAGMIGDVFGDSPLAAALTTVAAVILFMWLERHRNQAGDWTTRTLHFFLALVAWAIATPLLGLIFKIVGGLLAVAASTTEAGGSFVKFFYGLYEKHTVFVLATLALALALFGVWSLVRPRSPTWPFKLAACLLLFVLIVALGAPVAGLLSAPEDRSGPAQGAVTATPPR